MLNGKIRDMIQARFGREVKYSQDCEALSENIYEVTSQRLGVTTLKRMFGFTSAAVMPRESTMDIIACYLGYEGGYRALASALGPDTEISMFEHIDTIDLAELSVGTRLQVTYYPDRRIIMTYLGCSQFEIDTSNGSKLAKNDIITIANLSVGFDLLVSKVIRNGVDLGSYRAAKSGGLISIDLID